MKSKSLYIIILALLLLNNYTVSAQFGPGNENCGQENTLGTIINCTNCTIVTGSASGSLGGNQNLEVQANSCGPISITVRYSFDWIQGSNENWIHGISFNASNFWTSQEVDTPANWVFMPNGLTGCCSNSAYGPGYYYDGSNETTCINSNPCNSDNHGTITTIDGDPSNNYGVDCTDNCPVFDFTLTYCPLNNTNSTITEDFSFATSADGESGGYEEDQNCDVKNDFTITITNLCPTTADFNEIPNNYCNAPGVQLGNVASQYDGGNGPSEEWEGGIVQTSGDPNVIFEYCDNIGNTSISHTVGQDGCYAGPVTKNFQVWTPEITNLQVSPLEGCGEFQPSFSADIKIAGTNNDWQGGGFLEWLVDGVVVPDLTVTPENCGPKTVTFTPRFNTGCDDCNVLGNPVTITAYPNYTTQVLDDVMCGTAYARLIGQDGIEVCDQVEVSCLNNGDIANQSYNFNISNPLCPLSASGSIECACTSCVAEAGNLTLSGSFCPGSTVTPSTTGYNSDPEFTTVLLVVDGDDIISVNPLGSIVIPPTCKDFTLYTYNYETSGGSDPNPTTLSSIDCNTNCCDLSSPISLPVQSDLSVSCPPSISLPACTSLTDISTAFSSWKAGFSTSGGCNPITNNLGSIPVLPSIGCGEGLLLSFTLQASDICDTTPLTCTSTFEVMAAAPIQMTIPQDITVNCEDVPTAGQGDASTTAGCGIATISFSETIIGSIGPCGYTIVRTWTATDDCGTEVSKNQTITVLPAASPTYINPPQDIKIQCGETIPPGENLSITNGLSGACVLVETVSPTMMTVEESTIYTWSYINPCDNDLIEHTQTITEESETMDLAITSITCNDNSTDTDPSDDYYTLVFTVTTTVSSNSLYTVKIGSSSYGPYSYGQEITIDNYPATEEILSMYIADNTDSSCGVTRSLGPLVPCSNNCGMELTILEQFPCEDNGTTDIDDDYFKLKISAKGVNSSSEYIVFLSGAEIGRYTYDQEHIINNIPADGITYTLAAKDAQNTDCADSLYIQSSQCSTCQQTAYAGEDKVLTCDENSIKLSGSANPETGTYLWIGPDNTIYESKDILIRAPGNYILQVTYMDGCVAVDSVMVSANNTPPNAVIYADPDNTLDCTVRSITLSTQDQTNVTYTWKFNGVTFRENSIQVAEGGNVTLIALDTINQCQDTSKVDILNFIEYPILNMEKPDTLNCERENVVLKGTVFQSQEGIQYQWLDEDNNPIAAGTFQELIVNRPGTYFLQATDTSNNCSNIDTVSVVSNYELPYIVLNDTFTLPCDKSYLTITPKFGSQDYKITWRDMQGKELLPTEGILTIDSAGVYILKSIDAQSLCTREDTVLVHPAKIPTFALEGKDLLCYKDNSGEIHISEISGGTAPYEIKLNNLGSQEEIIKDLNAGTYIVTIEDALGCSSELEMVLNEPDILEIDLDEIVQILIGDEVKLTAQPSIQPAKIDSIYWIPQDSVSCSDCLSTVVKPYHSTTYTVTIVDKNGCEVSARVYVEVKREIDIYVPNVFSPNGDNKNDILNIFTNKPAYINSIEFMIYDRWGNTVYKPNEVQFNNPQWGWDGTHKEKPVSPGVYTFVLKYTITDDESMILSGDITLIK